MKKSTLGVSSFAAATNLSRSLSAGKVPPSERIRVGCVGVGGRAAGLLKVFSARKVVEIVSVTDVDGRRIPAAVETLKKSTGTAPTVAKDFRGLVDDASIDVLVVGTPGILTTESPLQGRRKSIVCSTEQHRNRIHLSRNPGRLDFQFRNGSAAMQSGLR